MKEIITNDGSVTLLQEDINETYHSQTGAAEEAVKKFVEPCQIASLAQNGEVRILDFCFGLGYNTAAALDAALQVDDKCVVHVVGLENDPEVIQKILDIETGFAHYQLVKDAVNNIFHGNVHLSLVVDDARQSLRGLEGGFDAVFFDPFSPQKCPELWTAEVFSQIFGLMKEGGRLATYSCARMVRDNLREAGFTVMDGPCVGRRSPSTIAVKYKSS